MVLIKKSMVLCRPANKLCLFFNEFLIFNQDLSIFGIPLVEFPLCHHCVIKRTGSYAHRSRVIGLRGLGFMFAVQHSKLAAHVSSRHRLACNCHRRPQSCIVEMAVFCCGIWTAMPQKPADGLQALAAVRE